VRTVSERLPQVFPSAERSCHADRGKFYVDNQASSIVRRFFSGKVNLRVFSSISKAFTLIFLRNTFFSVLLKMKKYFFGAL
jgi:hypothetical protein